MSAAIKHTIVTGHTSRKLFELYNLGKQQGLAKINHITVSYRKCQIGRTLSGGIEIRASLPSDLREFAANSGQIVRRLPPGFTDKRFTNAITRCIQESFSECSISKERRMLCEWIDSLSISDKELERLDEINRHKSYRDMDCDDIATIRRELSNADYPHKET